MKKILLALLIFSSCLAQERKTVFLATFAKDNALILPRFLKCLENLDHEKQAMTLYIHVGESQDDTKEIIQNWIDANGSFYREVIVDDWVDSAYTDGLGFGRTIRQRALEICQGRDEDYFFHMDSNCLIAPQTLRVLQEKNKPIIAPMLRAIPEFNDPFSNFFAKVSGTGYYLDDPMYWIILDEIKVGTFPVPVVHATYLVQKEAFKNLSYEDSTDEYDFIIFSRNARKNQIEQYICNEEAFGVLFHFENDPKTDPAEALRLKHILDLPSL